MVSNRCYLIFWDHIVLPDFMGSYCAAGFYGIIVLPDFMVSIIYGAPAGPIQWIYDVPLFQISGQLDGTSGRCRILWYQLSAAEFYGIN